MRQSSRATWALTLEARAQEHYQVQARLGSTGQCSRAELVCTHRVPCGTVLQENTWLPHAGTGLAVELL